MNKKIFITIAVFFVLMLCGTIIIANFIVPPYITNVSSSTSKTNINEKIINVEFEHYMFKLNKSTWCILSDTIPNKNDSGWIRADNGYCNFITNKKDFNIYIKDKYGNISDVNKQKIKSNNQKKVKVEMSKDVIYLYPGMEYKVNTKAGYKSIRWESNNNEVATVSNGIVSARSIGKTTIIADIDKNTYGEVEVLVTNLIKKPDATIKKDYVTCKQFTEDEADLLDKILEDRIKDKGYATRAGVVEAARFLALEFSYEIPYFYENGRLENYDPYEYVDGEGRYYHKGLYLSVKKYKDLKANFVGPAMWGCDLQNYTDWNNVYIHGEYYPNGFDCSGFVTWALLNGGFDIGDIGAGIDYNHKDLTDIGEKVTITEELMSSGRVKVGDLIGLDGHAAILVGWDEENYYIAESLNTTAGVVVTTVKKNDLVYNSIYKHIVLMDSVYKDDGKLSNMW